jgi:hypothetical protein
LKKFLKILVLTLALWQALFGPVSLSLVYAQDDTSSSTPTDTPTSTPTSTPDQTMVTGDASASADSQTDSNISDISTTPTPSPTDEPTPIDTSTPDATESATSVIDATGSATLDPEATSSTTPTLTPSDISVDQSRAVTTNTASIANSGNNTQQNENASGSATMTTGDAGSSSSSITVTNLSTIDSNLVTTVQNILTSNNNDVDLYQLLESAVAQNPNLIPANTNITVTQNANVSTNTVAESNTGENSQSSDSAGMQTGDATSVASAINATNLNLVGSNAVLFIINILGDYSGNIILPDGKTVSLVSLGLGNVNVNSNQSADVNANTEAGANSGNNNQTGGSTEMTTGTAVSTSNSNSFVNLVQIGGGWGYVVINNSGSWTGNLIGWTAPGSTQTLPQGTTNLAESSQSNTNGETGTTNITSNQTANVSTNVSADANTGSNNQTGESLNLTTGNAFSLANNFTLANITGVGANLFFGIINIFGNWTGNLTKGPYTPPASDPPADSAQTDNSSPDTRTPDLQITTTNNVGKFVYPGDTVLANITVVNQSAFTAHNVEVKGQLTNDHPMPAIPMDWKVGDLRPGGKAKINFSITLTSNLPAGQYNISATAIGDSESGDAVSVDSNSSFWVRVKGAIAEITSPSVLAESPINEDENVLGIETSKPTLDINKYLPYILASLAAAYLLILFARRKLEENEKNK